MNGSRAQIDETHHASSGDSSEKMAPKLFAKLSKKIIQKLYQVYEVDFHLFNYTYDEYSIS